MNKIKRIQKCSSLILAEKVLKAFNSIIKVKPLTGEWVTVECFENCREQGFHIKFITDISKGTFERRIVDISQQRNSDDIAVYAYTGEDESFGNRMKDEAWKRDGVQNYFRNDEVKKAAKFIHNFFTK